MWNVSCQIVKQFLEFGGVSVLNETYLRVFASVGKKADFVLLDFYFPSNVDLMRRCPAQQQRKRLFCKVWSKFLYFYIAWRPCSYFVL